jgi:exopolyphosphatase/pppGpp-phosphohydrolase
MMMQNSVEGLNWWHYDQPTLEELRLSGGLQVEDWAHARHVMYLSVQMFEATQPLHHLHSRDLHLLERAAFLHNTGMTVDTRRHHKHSFRLIKETALPDFTDKERHEIACIARYHRRALPSKEHEEFAALTPAGRKRVSKLSALLRVADALDFNHDGRVLHLAVDQAYCNRSVWTVSLWARPLAELDEELQHAQDKADLFEKVFRHKLHLSVQQD